MSEHTADDDPAALVRAMRGGERRAIARAATLLETLSPAAKGLLSAMQPHLGQALVVGVTGLPGAGKSTLVNAYVQQIRAAGRTIAVIAVDPSSPISGGAILGDRIRMTAAASDDGVFVRSLASRGALGGLSPAAVRIIDALDAAGFSIVVLETVGTGQSEIDVAEVADVRVLTVAPGLGDDIQAMKSGNLEIADIVVVNKGDLAGAGIARAQLASALAMRAGNRPAVPVLQTTATTSEGVDALTEAIARVGERRLAEPVAARRRRRARYLIARAAAELVTDRIRSGSASAIDDAADAVLRGELDARTAARSLAGWPNA
jgi:LAO/AO transport system kinase